MLERPLLALRRQNVELAAKAAIVELAGEIKGSLGHDLRKLLGQLLDIRTREGCRDDDDLTREMVAIIADVQSFDPAADRSRDPADRSGARYVGLSVELDALLQTHWIITT